MKSEKPGYYAILPATVRYDKTLSSSSKLLYAELTALMNYTGTCNATNMYFASLYGVSIRVVQDWLKELNQAGYIEVIQHRDGRDIRIRERKEDEENCMGGVKKTAGGCEVFFIPGTNEKTQLSLLKSKVYEGGVKKTAPPPDDLRIYSNTNTNINTSINTSKNINKNNIRTKILTTKEQELFNSFWAAYPKKVSKLPAEKAWKKINPDMEFLDRMLNAIQQQKKDKDNKIKYGLFCPDWAHPATWLNQHRWEDEITPIYNNGNRIQEEKRYPTLEEAIRR